MGTPEESPRRQDAEGLLVLVSVVVTCYNYADYLHASVVSALSQTGVRTEVIVVDDCSTDSSLVVANDLASRDERVIVLRHRVNRGPAAAFNTGLAHASGSYIVRLDADDMLTPGSLARSVALLEHDPLLVFCYGHPLNFSESAHPRPARTRVKGWTSWPGLDWLTLRCATGVNCITSPEVVIRHSALMAVGGMRQLDHAHDFELWMRLATLGAVGHVDGVDQAWHRVHPESLSTRLSNPLVDLRERRDAFAAVLNSDRELVPEPVAARLHEMAKRRLAREALEKAVRAYDRGLVGQEPIDAYVEFARWEYGHDLAMLPEWRALRRRQVLGQTWVKRLGIAGASRIRRRMLYQVGRRRWERRGI